VTAGPPALDEGDLTIAWCHSGLDDHGPAVMNGLFVQHDEVLGCRLDCHDARVRPAASGPGGEHPHVCSDVEDCLDRLGGQAVAHLTRRRLVLASGEQLEKSFHVAAVLHGDSNPCGTDEVGANLAT